MNAMIPILLMAPLASDTSEPVIEKIGVYGLEQDRISGVQSVVSKNGGAFSSLTVLVTVDVDGKVIEAKADENYQKLDPKPGLEAARNWRFKPQFFDGYPVQAVGNIEISYTRSEIPADKNAAFPAARPEDIEITLDRGACFGTCPSYRVSIRGDGLVRYTTNSEFGKGTDSEVHRIFNGDDVLWSGNLTARVEPEAVSKLLEQFRAAHFFGLNSNYAASITDAPTFALSVRIGDKTKL